MKLFEIRRDDCNSLYSRSIFCYNQGADTFTRKGIFDSWMQGCISIIQMNWIEEMDNYPGLHLEKDRHYVVLDPMKEDIMNIARDYNMTWANNVRRNLAEIVGKIIYSTHYPEFDDAFENTLTELWKVMKQNPPEWRRE